MSIRDAAIHAGEVLDAAVSVLEKRGLQADAALVGVVAGIIAAKYNEIASRDREAARARHEAYLKECKARGVKPDPPLGYIKLPED